MIHRTAILALTLAAIARPVHAQAPARTLIPLVRGNDGSEMALDPVTLSRTPDSTFVVQLVTRFPTPLSVGGVTNADRELDVEEVDCRGNRSRPLASVLFLHDTLVAAASLPREWKAVVADSSPELAPACAVIAQTFASLPVDYELERTDDPPTLANRDAIDQLREAEFRRLIPETKSDGQALFRFRVTPAGEVDTATVRALDGSHAAFVDAGRRVVEAMRFTPGRVAGHPVSVWLTLPVTFVQMPADEPTSR